MSESATEDRRAVGELVFGHMAAQMLAAAVRLSVADRVGAGERPAGEVAAELGTDPSATERLMRALAAHGFATEPRPGVFALTPRGALLRTDRPDSLADFVALFLDPVMVASWEHLDDSVRHGRPWFDELFGADFFTHLARDPKRSAQFNTSMRQVTMLVAGALPALVDFERFSSLTDVGGGDGTLLATVLEANPSLCGVLFDSVAGSAEAAPVIAGVADRCDVVSGDFFAGVPAGSDAYLLKSIVHDWNDDDVATILGHVRGVIPDDGRLFLLEAVLPATVDGSTRVGTYLTDLNMLVNVGGRERTEAEFRDVCARSGFVLESVLAFPQAPPFSVIEARPV